MNRLSYATALLIGAVYTVNVNTRFAAGGYGDEDLSNEIKELKKRQTEDTEFIQLKEHTSAFAQAAAKAGSGVRAKWIELPDCQTMIELDAGAATFAASFGEVIPLADDLSNAIIATCKGPYVAATTPVVVPPTPASPPAMRPKSVIYDPVWKTSLTVPDQEHGVAPLQQKTIDRSAETTGPTGDFWPRWRYEKGASP